MTQYALLGGSLNQQQGNIPKKTKNKQNGKKGRVDQITLTWPGI